MASAPDLSPGDWAVLGLVAEEPTHGFAVARLLSPTGEVGRVWTVPRPAVYQVMRKLQSLGLIAERSSQSSRTGPTRTIMAITAAGRKELHHWLTEPVDHVRDVRSLLLLKLALVSRSGGDITPLVDAQRMRLEPQIDALDRSRRYTEGFERVLAEWRYASSLATLEFLHAVVRSG